MSSSFFVSADITVPVYTIKEAAVKRSHSHSQANYKYLHPIMSEAFRRSLDCYYKIALLTGQQAELIMQLPLLSTMYAYDSQQVIYIFDKMHVKGCVSKNVIHRDCRR